MEAGYVRQGGVWGLGGGGWVSAEAALGNKDLLGWPAGLGFALKAASRLCISLIVNFDPG